MTGGCWWSYRRVFGKPPAPPRRLNPAETGDESTEALLWREQNPVKISFIQLAARPASAGLCANQLKGFVPLISVSGIVFAGNPTGPPFEKWFAQPSTHYATVVPSSQTCRSLNFTGIPWGKVAIWGECRENAKIFPDFPKIFRVLQPSWQL